MCALHSKLNGRLAAAPARARCAPAAVGCHHRSGVEHQRRVAAAAGKWKVFGPTNSYSDGDAEFYRVSNSLAQQYEWFAPRPEEEDAAAADEEGLLEQQDPRKPLYGLTPQQIAALGLSGNRVNTPDPVSGAIGEQKDLAAAVVACTAHQACCGIRLIISCAGFNTSTHPAASQPGCRSS